MKFYKHPAYVGYANKKLGKKRLKKFKKQYEEKGFDDTVTWSLDHSTAKFLYPRLVSFYELSDKIIDIDAHEGFRQALEEMIEGFKLAANGDDLNKENCEKISKAWVLLGEWYNKLWW